MFAHFSFTPADVLSLAQELALPASVCQKLTEVTTPALLRQYAADCETLTSPLLASATWEKLDSELSTVDPSGMRLLALYLAAACLTRQKYRSLGIPDEIFLRTAACFPRFLQETFACTGSYTFDRAFWVWRQLSCLLFRLGTLEFEYCAFPTDELPPPGLAAGSPVISVHIPSDAVFSESELQASYRMAEEFFAAHGAALCPFGAPQATFCGTWLLSPSLQTLLGPSSGICLFAADYELYAVDEYDDQFYRWLFNGLQPPAALPQNTSLQRAVAAHLRNGGKIGCACGTLRRHL